MNEWIAQRYHLGEVLGRGGYGCVWRAWDAVLERPVAVKLLAVQTFERRAAVLREVALLRRLRVAGVVHFLDEGVVGEQIFLVMELVEGRAFPGRAGKVRWEAIASTVDDLLGTIDRVHALGVLHGDLKPENVLVRPDGTVVVLDFGVASRAFEHLRTDDPSRSGTRQYMAPELFEAGAHSTVQSDLYALGYMLYQALGGAEPFEDEPMSTRAIATMRRKVRAVSLREREADVPPAVAAVVNAMLEGDAQRRFNSAAEVRRRLAGAARSSRGVRALPVIPPRPAVEDLVALFAGPDRLHHLATDAARLLHARSGGEVSGVLRVARLWERDGLMRQGRDGRFVIDREALELLGDALGASLQVQVDALGATATTVELASVVELARAEALRAAREGRLGAAQSILSETARAIRRPRVSDLGAACALERVLLSLWIEVALADGTTRALYQVRSEVCRARLDEGFRHDAEALVRAALTVGKDNPRAKAMADAAGPFDDAALERLRHDVRVRAARGGSRELERRTVEEAVAWAETRRDPRAGAMQALWRARLEYREGAFERSAELAEEAARAETWATAAMGAMWYAAGSWLEAFEFERARSLAREARALAERGRHPLHEARAELVERMALYRLGELTEPDEEWVDLVADLGVAPLEASAALNEAAVAWRAGRQDVAARLAARAEQHWRSMRHVHPADLARCLSLACGTSARPGEAGELAARALGCDIAGLGVQSLALLVVSGVAAREALADAVVEQGGLVPRARWDDRADVLSVREALALAGVAGVQEWETGAAHSART